MAICFLNIISIKNAASGFDMMYCLCSKKISCHLIYLFINVCGLCADVTYHGKDPLINAFMV